MRLVPLACLRTRIEQAGLTPSRTLSAATITRGGSQQRPPPRKRPAPRRIESGSGIAVVVLVPL